MNQPRVPLKVLLIGGSMILLLLVILGHHRTQSHRVSPVPSSAFRDTASGDTNAELLRELTAKYQQVQRRVTALQNDKANAEPATGLDKEAVRVLHAQQTALSKEVATLKHTLHTLQTAQSDKPTTVPVKTATPTPAAPANPWTT